MTYPWRRAVSLARRFVQSREEAQRNVITARAAEEAKSKLSKEDVTSIALGVTFSVLILALVGFGFWFFFVKPKNKTADVESGVTEKRNWWMVTDSKNAKGGITDWWRKSYAVPDRVEPPPSAGPRSSLQRIRSVLTRKGALRGVAKKGSPLNDQTESVTPPKGKVTSPAMTIDLPMQTVPQLKPRYPSILERDYRVPLYPTQSPPKDNAPSRSLTSPAPPHPIIAAELTSRRKVSVPPRALKISNGRPLLTIAERQMGRPRSPAHRRKAHLVGQFKHPFIPLKDTDTDFPTISAPMPSTENAETNPKLGYAYSMSRPRIAPAPTGPRVSRTSTRRVPVPILVQSAPLRTLMPATPRHLREETRILPPGQSSSVPRLAPTPI